MNSCIHAIRAKKLIHNLTEFFLRESTFGSTYASTLYGVVVNLYMPLKFGPYPYVWGAKKILLQQNHYLHKPPKHKLLKLKLTHIPLTFLPKFFPKIIILPKII
jgi:hypothetical protein